MSPSLGLNDNNRADYYDHFEDYNPIDFESPPARGRYSKESKYKRGHTIDADWDYDDPPVDDDVALDLAMDTGEDSVEEEKKNKPKKTKKPSKPRRDSDSDDERAALFGTLSELNATDLLKRNKEQKKTHSEGVSQSLAKKESEAERLREQKAEERATLLRALNLSMLQMASSNNSSNSSSNNANSKPVESGPPPPRDILQDFLNVPQLLKVVKLAPEWNEKIIKSGVTLPVLANLTQEEMSTELGHFLSGSHIVSTDGQIQRIRTGYARRRKDDGLCGRNSC
jgi:hypothetical protein